MPLLTVSTMAYCCSWYRWTSTQLDSVSFLQVRTQHIFYKRGLSEIFQLFFGVPQGSVLGPLFFLSYMSELLDIVAEFGLTSHAYVDDTQLFISV